MSVTAAQMQKSGAKSKELDVVVHEQLLIIDAKLQKAERAWGRNVLSHELPTAFTFAGLSKKDAQRIIYTMIVRSLTTRGFGVRLLLQPDRTVAYIEWVTDLTDGEVQAMTRLIQEVIIRPEEVDDFIAGNTRTSKNAADARDGAATS